MKRPSDSYRGPDHPNRIIAIDLGGRTIKVTRKTANLLAHSMYSHLRYGSGTYVNYGEPGEHTIPSIMLPGRVMTARLRQYGLVGDDNYIGALTEKGKQAGHLFYEALYGKVLNEVVSAEIKAERDWEKQQREFRSKALKGFRGIKLGDGRSMAQAVKKAPRAPGSFGLRLDAADLAALADQIEDLRS